MSLVDIGLRNLPNFYVDKAHLVERMDTIPKMLVSFVLKDGLINNRRYWSDDLVMQRGSSIVYILEDKRGNIYSTNKQPLSSVFEVVSTQIEGNNNTTYTYVVEKTIDLRVQYYNQEDKSLVLRTYVEKLDPDGTVYRSSVMRKVLQNSNGLIPDRSFYFTLPNGQVYSGPFHYHEPTDSFMVGEKHSSEPHPNLTIRYTNNNTVTSQTLEKTLALNNTQKNTYSFNPKTIITNYTTKNNDRSVSNLFIIDLYKLLLQIDEDSQKIFELNKDLFSKIISRLEVKEMSISRIEVDTQRSTNELSTEVIKSSEIGVEKHLVTLYDVKEDRYTNERSETEVYFADDALYAMLTDYDIKHTRDGRYKYVTNIKLNSTVSNYIDQVLSRLYEIISYYELLLVSLENSSLYDERYQKLTSSYVRDLFAEFTDFITDDSGFLVLKQKPEFHKHIDSVIESISLLKTVSANEKSRIQSDIDQLISPLSTDRSKISNFIKICRDLVYQINSSYKRLGELKNKPIFKQSKRLQVEFRDNQEFDYSNIKRSFNVFKNLMKPIVSPAFLKNRFQIERDRYFEGSLGDTKFNTLTPKIRQSFVSEDSRFQFLSPLSLHTSDKEVDLQNFDIFDDVAEGIFPTPTIRVEKKIQSNLSLLNEDGSFLDAADILSEASDFVINKLKIRRNVFSQVDPVVLNYTFSPNALVDIDDDKFNLDKQENLLLSYIKNKDESNAPNIIRELPIQTKALFYPDSLRNPLNRIKATNNFKVKRLVKNIAFTTYRVEYLTGYSQEPNSFRSVHQPTWRNMENPDRIQTNSKYNLLKISNNDMFGFRNVQEFEDNQRFILMRNDNYSENTTQVSDDLYVNNYTLSDLDQKGYSSFNLLDNDIQLTSMVTSMNLEESDYSRDRYNLLNSVRNSKTANPRSRQAVRARVPASTDTPASISTTPVQSTPARAPTPTTITRGSY